MQVSIFWENTIVLGIGPREAKEISQCLRYLLNHDLLSLSLPFRLTSGGVVWVLICWAMEMKTAMVLGWLAGWASEDRNAGRLTQELDNP